MSKKMVVYNILLFLLMSIPLSFSQDTLITPLKGKRICVDAGAGVVDDKKLSDFETEVNLRIAFFLQGMLEGAGAIVTLSSYEGGLESGKSKEVILMHRAMQSAQKGKADLILSIHHRYSEKKDANYITVLCAPEGDSKLEALASAISTSLSNALKIKAASDPNITVLKNISRITVPIIYINCGVITNKAEKKKLKDMDYCRQKATAIFKGFLEEHQKSVSSIKNIKVVEGTSTVPVVTALPPPQTLAPPKMEKAAASKKETKSVPAEKTMQVSGKKIVTAEPPMIKKSLREKILSTPTDNVTEKKVVSDESAKKSKKKKEIAAASKEASSKKVTATIKKEVKQEKTAEQKVEKPAAQSAEKPAEKPTKETVSPKKSMPKIAFEDGQQIIFEPPFDSPIDASIDNTSLYGEPYKQEVQMKKFKKGVSFDAPKDTPIKAVADGIVETVNTSPKISKTAPYTKCVVIKHNELYANQTVYSVYGHVNGMKVKAGDPIKKGDILGSTSEIGTGNDKIRTEFVFEIRLDKNLPDYRQNPELLIKQFKGEGLGMVIGKVVNSKGEKIPGIKIEGFKKPEGTSPYKYSMTYVPESKSTLSYDENFAVTGVTTGTYTITTNKGNSRTVEVKANEIVYLVWKSGKAAKSK